MSGFGSDSVLGIDLHHGPTTRMPPCLYPINILLTRILPIIELLEVNLLCETM